MKVTIIGAGNVGAMVASRIVDADLSDVVLIDIVPGMAEGKALDISDARPIAGSSANITGAGNFNALAGSDIVVVTAGLARKPGMSRDDLLKKNAQIIKDISGHIKKYCPSSIVIIVTNPLDVMAYLTMKTTGIRASKVIGMAGVLDSARFINIVSEKVKGVAQDKIFMMGSHGDTMVAINRSEELSDDIFKETSARARDRGAEIVGYLKTGSAYFAPSAAVFYMVRAILKDEGARVCASGYLEGQYGQKDIYMGVPLVLDASGVREIVEIKLTDDEKASFKESACKIRESIKKVS